jgi:hypothetical protein
MKKIYTLFFITLMTGFFYDAHAQIPDCAVNISPVNTATSVDPYPMITLKWQPVAGATSYDVYVSAKTPPKQLIGNTSADSLNFYDASYQTTYYWYVVPKNASGQALGCISNLTSFTTIAAPAPPSNDDCGSAQSLSEISINGTTIGATQSMPANICNGYAGTANDDVWYQFIPSKSGTVIISMQGSENFDGVLEAFSGDCNSLVSLLCSDSSQFGGREELTLNVTAGITYKVRLYNFYPDLSARGTFNIAVSGLALSVKMLYFKVEHVANKNLLRWSTAQEQNNKGFEVQYSFNGKDFNQLCFVDSKGVNGNSSSILSYEIADANPTGNLYYRIKQIDKDGKAWLSEIIFVRGETNKQAFYPNPVKNLLNLMINSSSENTIKLEVKDVAGRSLIQTNGALVKGLNHLTLNTTSLAGGSYLLKVTDEKKNLIMNARFVKE